MTEKEQQRQWEIEDDARTLKNFAKLKRNKKRLNAAREYLKKEIADSKKVLQTTQR